jgi:hypothetical protein
VEAFEPEWQVTRKDGTVYVDVSAVGRLSGADSEAIVAATEDLLGDDVSFVQVHAALKKRTFNGLGRTLKTIHRLAEAHGKQVVISPI